MNSAPCWSCLHGSWCVEARAEEIRSQLELYPWLIAEDEKGGSTGKLEIPYDKKVLASRLGMAPEVLSRSIAALIPYKVDIRGRHVQLNDREALLSLARPVPTIDDPAC